MKKQFSISAQDYKWIKEQAVLLPDVSLRTSDGKTIMRRKVDVKQTTFVSGNKRDSKGRITNNTIKTSLEKSFEPVLVNHENELVCAWKAKGKEGAEIYIQIINQLEKDTIVEKSYSITYTLVENLVRRKIVGITDPKERTKIATEKVTGVGMEEAFKIISSAAVLFFDIHPALLTNQDMKNICLEEVPEKYKELEGWIELHKVLTQYYNSI